MQLKRNYETLDAIVVIGAMLIVGGGVAALIFRVVPSENLAVVSGLLGTIAGTILGGYAGFRWGASIAQAASKPTPPDAQKAADSAANRVADAAAEEAATISDEVQP